MEQLRESPLDLGVCRGVADGIVRRLGVPGRDDEGVERRIILLLIREVAVEELVSKIACNKTAGSELERSYLTTALLYGEITGVEKLLAGGIDVVKNGTLERSWRNRSSSSSSSDGRQ